MTQVAIIKSGGANFTSITSCLDKAGASWQVTSAPDTILNASHVILPGVGSAHFAMQELHQNGLATLIPALRQPVLGICLGMQILGTHSEEGNVPCLNIIPVTTRKIPPLPGLAIPHIGWENITLSRHDPLFDSITHEDDMYFVHGYAVEPQDPYILATCEYGLPIAAAIRKENFRGVQFHPEKSGRVGIRLIENFLRITA